jgi:hypothetical protein
MFQYPGSGQDNVKEDVRRLRQWLNQFLPELEHQLSNLGTDNFSTAYNERMEGVTTLTGAGKQKTTSEALAEHLLDYNNPHRVTLAQLGLNLRLTDHGWVIMLGGLLIQAKTVTLEAGNGTAHGSIYRRQMSLGDWDIKFSELLGTWISWSEDAENSIWGGTSWGAYEESAGETRIYSPVQAFPACRITVYGIGRADDGNN